MQNAGAKVLTSSQRIAGHGGASKKEGVKRNEEDDDVDDEAEEEEEGEEKEDDARRRETGGDEGDAYRRTKGGLVTFPWSRRIRNEITSVQ